MKFDSHVEILLTAATGLVNAATPGHDGTRPVDGDATGSDLGAVLVSRGGPSRPTRADVEQLTAWAARVREVFECADDGRVDTSAGLVNDLLDDTGARPRLDRHDDGWNLHFHGPDDGLVVGWTAGIASALALVVGSAWAGRLGVCSAVPCDRVYVDDSRNGSRRFCSTRCQNRVKAAAHRARRP